MSSSSSSAVPRKREDPCVLVVDDDPDFRDSIKHVMEGEGYRVMLARTGKDALLALQTETIDLVVLDLLMPEMSGRQVLDAIKSDAELSDIPVIVMTASGLRQGAFGATPVLSKHLTSLPRLMSLAATLRAPYSD